MIWFPFFHNKTLRFFQIVPIVLILSVVALSEDALMAPNYSTVPKDLTFTCQSRIPGYYADVQARCQVWHWCLPSGAKYSFLCPHGTVFNQNFRVCDWWFNVDCESSPNKYNINEDLYKIPDRIVIK